MYTNNIFHGRGRLVYDPNEVVLENGKKATFVLAINNKRKTKDNQYIDDVDFVNCEVWDSAAEYIVKYFKKGQHVEIVGSLKSYAVKLFNKDNNEVTTYKSYIRVNSFSSLGSPKEKTTDE